MNTILLVEDEADIREPCVEFLKMMGHDVYGAQSSKEAFELIQKYKPNILILDLNLKEKLTGLDVYKKALELVPNAKAAIVTGLGEGKIAEECAAAGVKIILEKPMAIEKFQETVERLIKGE